MNAIPGVAPNHKGIYNLNCPYCGDKRGRLGIFVLPGGGIRAKCFNGGCAFENPTGWEPGGRIGGRLKLMFKLLGGNVMDLPMDAMSGPAGPGNRLEDKRGWTDSFQEVELPRGCVNAFGPGVPDSVAEYLASRGEELCASHEFLWSPAAPTYAIVPFRHYGRVVGYMGRNTSASGQKFIGRCAQDYIFAQDTIRDASRSVILVEGVFDAIAIGGVAGRSSALTKSQAELLDDCGSAVIVLPDQQQEGLSYVEAARKRGWYVSIPEWDPGVKDAAQAAARYGKLYAIESVVSGACRDYNKAAMAIKLRGLR